MLVDQTTTYSATSNTKQSCSHKYQSSCELRVHDAKLVDSSREKKFNDPLSKVYSLHKAMLLWAAGRLPSPQFQIQELLRSRLWQEITSPCSRFLWSHAIAPQTSVCLQQGSTGGTAGDGRGSTLHEEEIDAPAHDGNYTTTASDDSQRCTVVIIVVAASQICQRWSQKSRSSPVLPSWHGTSQQKRTGWRRRCRCQSCSDAARSSFAVAGQPFRMPSLAALVTAGHPAIQSRPALWYWYY